MGALCKLTLGVSSTNIQLQVCEVNACPYICIHTAYTTAYTYSVFSTHVCLYMYSCVRVCGSDWASVCGRQGGSCIWWCCAFVCVRDICIQGSRNFQKFWAVRVCVLARKVSDVRLSLAMVHGLFSASCIAEILLTMLIAQLDDHSLSLLFEFLWWSLPKWQINTAQQYASKNHT